MKPNSEWKPPRYLSKEARAWCKAIAETWDLQAHQFEVLAQAGGCLDRISQAESIVAKDGPVVYDGHGFPKAHPAMLIERDQKTLFARLVRELNLSQPADDSRPPALRGRYVGRD